MSTGEERRLKLVKTTPTADPTTTGADDRQSPAGGSGSANGVRRPGEGIRPGRAGRAAATRRTVTRRIPGGKDPVEAILERLDQEPTAEETASRPTAGPTGRPASQDAVGGAVDEPRATARPTTADPTTTSGDLTTSEEPGSSDDGSAPTGRKWFGIRRMSRARKTSAVRAASARRSGTTVGLVAVLCAALALAGVFGYRWQQDRAIDRAHTHALAAARQTTVNFVSVSASSVDRDLQRITAGATGEFEEEFARSQAQVRAAVLENKVESRGTVLRAGLLSGDRRSAVVLVAVDATVKNVHSPDGRLTHYRIQVDLTRERDSDTWLVSRLQFVA